MGVSGGEGAGVSGGDVSDGAGVSGGDVSVGTGVSGGGVSGAGVSGGVVSLGAGVSGGEVSVGAGVSGAAVCTGAGVSGGDVSAGAGVSGGEVCTGAGVSAEAGLGLLEGDPPDPSWTPQSNVCPVDQPLGMQSVSSAVSPRSVVILKGKVMTLEAGLLWWAIVSGWLKVGKWPRKLVSSPLSPREVT